MPNIRIKGVPNELVKQYGTQINQIAGLLGCSPDKIFIIDDGQATVYALDEIKNPVYITVEWKQRLAAEQVMVDHLTNFFKDYSANVRITFRDFDNQWYVNGQKS